MPEKSEARIRAEILYNEQDMSPKEIAQRVSKKKETVRKWVSEEEETEEPEKTGERRKDISVVDALDLSRFDRWDVYVAAALFLIVILIALALA